MKRIKFPLLIIAMVIAITGSFATNIAKRANDPVVYHYTSTSTSLGDMQNISNWQSSGPSCVSSGPIPCAFTYEGDFSAYLQTFTNAVTLKNAADSRRTP